MKKYFKFISYIFVILMSIFITENVYAEDKEYFSQDNKYAIKISNVYLYSEAENNGKNSIIKENISWKAEPKFSVPPSDGPVDEIIINPTLSLDNEEIKKIALKNTKNDGTFEGYIEITYSYKLPEDIESVFFIEQGKEINFILSLLNASSNSSINEDNLYIPIKKIINNNYTEQIDSKLYFVKLDSNQNLTIEPTITIKETDIDGNQTTTSSSDLFGMMILLDENLEKFSYQKIINEKSTIMLITEVEDPETNLDNDNNEYFQLTLFDGNNNIISGDIFKNINTNGILINIVDDNDNLLYSWKFDKEDIVNTNINLNLNILINKSDKKDLIEKIYKGIDATYLSFDHEGDFPGRASIKIKISDIYSNGDELYLYYFNENTNKLELVSEKNKVEDGYIEIEIDHASDYILTKDKIDVDAVYQDVKNPQTGVNHFITLIFTLLISVMLIIVYCHKKNKFPQI